MASSAPQDRSQIVKTKDLPKKGRNRENKFYWLRPQWGIDYKAEKIDYQTFWRVEHKKPVDFLGDVHINVEEDKQAFIKLEFSIGSLDHSSKGNGEEQPITDDYKDEVVVNVFRVDDDLQSGLSLPRIVNTIKFKI